jgi:7,8-dihydropterin-6-yl-methyl-4-(beta-D-ribofuranosyl)aminobenzene 5'-phosphate synthase
MWRADNVEILVLVENQIDMLLPDLGEDSGHCVSRAGLIHHFDPKEIPVQAENGISLLVTARRGPHELRVMFDVGMTGRVMLHNLKALHQDLNTVDHIVISHGHPDHYGGIIPVLEEFPRSVPVATHPDAFLPRYAVMGDGRVASYYNEGFQPDRLEGGPGRPVLTKDPLELGNGVLTTGEIPRNTDFEGPVISEDTRKPGLYQVAADGQLRTDEVWDEQGLVIDLGSGGLVVLTGCAHAGVVNTIHRAQELTGNERIRAVMGGFHLGFPTTPPENVDKTLEAIRALEVETVMPMHCSGLRAHTAFSTGMDRNYVQPAVGSVLTFGPS